MFKRTHGMGAPSCPAWYPRPRHGAPTRANALFPRGPPGDAPQLCAAPHVPYADAVMGVAPEPLPRPDDPEPYGL